MAFEKQLPKILLGAILPSVGPLSLHSLACQSANNRQQWQQEDHHNNTKEQDHLALWGGSEEQDYPASKGGLEEQDLPTGWGLSSNETSLMIGGGLEEQDYPDGGYPAGGGGSRRIRLPRWLGGSRGTKPPR